jgi:hypothetical protein
MKVRTLLAAVALLVAAGALPVLGQKPKVPSVVPLPVWTAKGLSSTQFVPGLTAALLLTTGQREQLARAWQETMGSEAVAAAGRTLKRDPTATEAQRQAARAVIDAASAGLQQRIAAILTTDQKSLIEWINSVFTEVGKTVAAEMEKEYAAAKGDKEALGWVQQQWQEKLDTAFLAKLKEMLNPEQWAALTKAMEQEKRTVEGAAKGKGGEIRLKSPADDLRGKGKSEKELRLKD